LKNPGEFAHSVGTMTFTIKDHQFSFEDVRIGGDAILLSKSGNAFNEIIETASPGSYSNTDFTVTLNGAEYATQYGPLNKKGVATYLTLMLLTTNASGAACAIN